jgi:hypothetical protein
MGLMSITHSLLKESGLTDGDVRDLTGLDKKWINRFRTEKRGEELISRVEAVHDAVKKVVMKQRRKTRRAAQ